MVKYLCLLKDRIAEGAGSLGTELNWECQDDLYWAKVFQ